MGLLINPYAFGAASPSWSPVTIAAPNTNSGGWAGYNMRQAVDTSIIPITGNLVRFSIKGGTVEGVKLTSCYIGIQKPGAGNSTIFNAAPVQVTFNGGSTTCTVGTNATQFTDTISLVRAAGESYLVSFFVAAADSAQDTYFVNTSVTGMLSWYVNNGSNESSQITPSGMTGNGGQCHFLNFEVSP